MSLFPNFKDFSFPLMPGLWWAVLLINGFAIFLFGKSFYFAFYRFLCDIVYQIVTPKTDRMFDLYGVYLFCGRVGTGKTISMVRRAELIKKRYPHVKIMANFHTDIADGFITCWEDVLYSENIDEKTGVNNGILFLFDEIHLTFDSQSWKDAPVNLLEYVSLQRHYHKCIFGSSQVWSRVNKVLREQTDWVVECKTYFGKRLVRNTTFSQEEYNVNGELKDSGFRHRHHKSNFCYYASDRLRSLYNTDEIVGKVHNIGMTKDQYRKKFLDDKEE